MPITVSTDNFLWIPKLLRGPGNQDQGIDREAALALAERRERVAGILAKSNTGIVRVNDSSRFEVAGAEDADSVYELFVRACNGSETSGFLRNTYSKEELSAFISEGNVRLIRDEQGKTAAFMVVVPGDHKQFSLERLAVGIKALGIFIKTCTWLEGKFEPLDWPNVRYIALFAQSERHMISPELSKRLIKELAQEDPSKELFLSVSAEPKPNLYMRAVVEEMGFKRVGFFRSILGRPMMFVDGTRWIRPWRSDIYKYADNN